MGLRSFKRRVRDADGPRVVAAEMIARARDFGARGVELLT
jgi:hypothetical protein